MNGGKLDPAFAALLADPRIALRRPPPGVSVETLRAAANRFMARAPSLPIFASQDLRASGPGGNIPLRLYRPSAEANLPVILFFHGGGFVFGSLDTHDAMCRSLSIATQAAVVAVDYRLAPEHPFPAALDDCRTVLAWLVATAGDLGLDANRIAICGDSAGGQLALATTITDGGAQRLRHLALFYPLLDPARSSPSHDALGKDYMLTGSFLDWAWEAYGAAPDARLAPSFDLTRARIDLLPSTTIVIAEFDPLRDEGEQLAENLRRAGNAVELRRYDGMIHGFAGLPQLTPVAGEAIAFVGDRLQAALES